MRLSKLDSLSLIARKDIVKFHYNNKRSHLASSLSCIDIIIHLYFNKMSKDDIFILSKGHAYSALYTTLKMKGFKTPIPFPANPIRDVKNGVFCSTGSLGHGLPIACGVAMSNRKKNVYVLISDGELNEGSNWEAIQFAQHNHLSNLTVLVDNNGWQASGRCVDVINLQNLTYKFIAFGWQAYALNGHSHEELDFHLNIQRINNSPIALVCNTIKCKGLINGENSNKYHYGCPDEKDLL